MKLGVLKILCTALSIGGAAIGLAGSLASEKKQEAQNREEIRRLIAEERQKQEEEEES